MVERIINIGDLVGYFGGEFQDDEVDVEVAMEWLKKYLECHGNSIVRCKDCKHYRTRWVGFCELIGNENIHRENDDFCSYGERKDTD